MVDTYHWIDSRTKSALDELRLQRREAGIAERMPALRQKIQQCREKGDLTYRDAFLLWDASLIERNVDLSVNRKLLIPEELRVVRGLFSQRVLRTVKGEILGMDRLGNFSIPLFEPSQTVVSAHTLL